MKMRTARIIVTVIAILTFGLVLTACSSSGDNRSGAQATASAESSGNAGASSESMEAAAFSPSGVSPSQNGALHVEGTQLVDRDGHAVQLRGASTHGLAWFPAYVNDALFGELRSDWGANVVRLALYTAESSGWCTDGDKVQLRKLVDDGVAYATDNDLYVIIDWHILSDNDPNMHADEAEAFFRDVSAAYADHDNVLYEICNEPNGATTWADVKRYAERIIPVIRENDADAVVIVGTPTWSQDVDVAAADPLAFDNVMYTLHYYAATHKDDLRAKAAAALDAGLPLFVTEFGICDASGNGAIDEGQADIWTAFLDERGVSYVMWNLSNKAESSAMFKATCDKASGFEDTDLSQSGAWLKRVLADGGASAANAASIATSSASPASGGQASSAASSATASTASSPVASSESTLLTSGDIEYRMALRNSWVTNGESYFLYNITLVNNGDPKDSWSIEAPFSADARLSDSWNGAFTVEGSTVHVSNAPYNGALASGGAVSDVGFIVVGPADLKLLA